METHDLIRAISVDAGKPGLSMRATWVLAGLLAIVAAALAFFAMLGPRPDFAQAAMTMRFPFKFVVTLAVALTAFVLLSELARPVGKTRNAWLFVGPLLLLGAVAIEMFVLPPEQWEARMMGTNSMKCLAFIPLIAIVPLIVFLLALRHGATTRPRFSGAVSGVLAGGLAATFYAAHCPDDSPLFVAIWYTLAILGMTLIGSLVGPRVTRW